jgi:hypothetical protein
METSKSSAMMSLRRNHTTSPPQWRICDSRHRAAWQDVRRGLAPLARAEPDPLDVRYRRTVSLSPTTITSVDSWFKCLRVSTVVSNCRAMLNSVSPCFTR